MEAGSGISSRLWPADRVPQTRVLKRLPSRGSTAGLMKSSVATDKSATLYVTGAVSKKTPPHGIETVRRDGRLCPFCSRRGLRCGGASSLVGLVWRASGSETFKRFLPHAPFSNSAPAIGAKVRVILSCPSGLPRLCGRYSVPARSRQRSNNGTVPRLQAATPKCGQRQNRSLSQPPRDQQSATLADFSFLICNGIEE